MAYDKQTWVTGEVITAEKLNHMENGIEDNNPTDAQVATAVGEWLAENVDPVGSAVTVDSTLSISGSAGDAKKTGELIAPVFDSTSTYAIGDYCLYGGKVYRFTSEHTGAWSEADVEETNIGRELSFLNNQWRTIDLPYATIANIVRSGRAKEFFQIGQQIPVEYTEGSTTYTLPYDIVAFRDVELENGNTVPGMIIQSHYAMQDVQFSASQAIYVVKGSALPAGTYNFTIGTSWGTHCVEGKSYQFTTTEEIPVGGQIVVGNGTNFYTWGAPDVAVTNWKVHTFSEPSSITPLESLAVTEGTGGTSLVTVSSSVKYDDGGFANLQSCAYGYNRWGKSANRQFYNSAESAGNWWSPSYDGDRPPQQLASKQGFMHGFAEDFLAMLKPVKVVTALNTVSDNNIGATETTYDTFFLASLEEEYIVPQLAGVEGDYWEYWKNRLALSSPQAWYAAGANEAHIRTAYTAQSSAQSCRLRSAYRGYAHYTWLVGTTGNVYSNAATYALRGCPDCVIC